jgi:hypothetical protein
MTENPSQWMRPGEADLVSALEPDRNDRSCPPHTWECPVLTKLDPLAIAWTCADCGEIVTAPVGAPRPRGDGRAVLAATR